MIPVSGLQEWSRDMRGWNRFGCLGLGGILALAIPGRSEEKTTEAAAPALAAEAVPATPVPAPAAATTPCEACTAFDFSKVPPVQPFPRMGAFLVPPTGPNYYTFMDLLRGECRDKPPVNPY